MEYLIYGEERFVWVTKQGVLFQEIEIIIHRFHRFNKMVRVTRTFCVNVSGSETTAIYTLIRTSASQQFSIQRPSDHRQY